MPVDSALEAGMSADPQRADGASNSRLTRLRCTPSIGKEVNKQMSPLSSLHLSFVWNRSRRRCSPTFI